VQQAVDALLGEALLPAPDSGPAGFGSAATSGTDRRSATARYLLHAAPASPRRNSPILWFLNAAMLSGAQTDPIRAPIEDAQQNIPTIYNIRNLITIIELSQQPSQINRGFCRSFLFDLAVTW
jgi:hypothetical protein